MEFIALISKVAQIITRAIPFVEELFGAESGASKSAVVMNIAQIAVAGVEGQIAKESPKWQILAPLAQRFINDAIAAINEIKTGKKQPLT